MNTNHSSPSKSGGKSAKMRTVVIKLSRKLSMVYTWRPGNRISRLLTSLLASLLAVCAAPALALPTGGQVVSGNITIQSPSSTSMTVTQGSNKGVINWNGFSIAQGEAVNYAQPSASSVTLNRVLGNDLSTIFGSLSANGQVFLINPNGVMFAPGAQVNVGGLVASTLGLSDANFLAGRYAFEKGTGAGSIDNQGGLNGKYIALIAPNINNGGNINANTAVLAAGNRVSLDISGDGMLAASVDSAAANASIKHSGSIAADAGQVFISVRSANALLDTVLNVSGVVRAQCVSKHNGVILLDGGNAGVVSVSGNLDTSGTSTGQIGGAVTVLGKYVGLFDGASINVSGDGGGGTALIGGNYHGAGPEAHASMTYVGKDATINADAITNGKGGQVAVWSDNATKFYGNISARGGAQGGDGGFVEVSGKQYFGFAGLVNTTAAHGNTGTLLLDPTDMTIIHATDALSDTFGTVTGTFTDSTATPPGDISDFTINSQLATNNVTVSTTNDIVVSTAAAIDLQTRRLTLTATTGGILYGGPLSQDNNAVGLSFALDFTRSGSALPRFCL